MGTPLSLRYHWDRRRAEVHWDAKDSSPRLTLTARGQDVGSLEPMEPELWHALGDEWSVRLETLLKESSFVLVHGHASRPGLLLVQEEGMSHKPSRLFQLTVPEILRYWAMLTPAQRAAFVEVKAPELAISELGAEWVARVMPPETIETLFDRFAGCFHAFNCLRDEVRLQLAEGRHAQANYRLFGRKYDSLGTLLDLAAKESSPTDDVNRYVVFMCARQLCRELSREFSDYWKTQQEGARALEDRLAQCAEIRNRLAGKDTEMPAFLDWFDEWFLSRATRMEDER